MLAEKLNMTPEEAERWIVNLIRNARLDAKIDSKQVGRTFRCFCISVKYICLFSFTCMTGIPSGNFRSKVLRDHSFDSFMNSELSISKGSNAPGRFREMQGC